MYIVDCALHKTYPVQRSYKTEKHYKLAPTVVSCAKKKTKLKYLISKLLLNCANSTMDNDKVYIELSFYIIRGPEKPQDSKPSKLKCTCRYTVNKYIGPY